MPGRTRLFYAGVLGGEVLREGEPSIVALANSWIVINVGGPPTGDKPTVTLEPPRDPDHVSSFLNVRVADIHAVYQQRRARGAEFLTPPAGGVRNSAATCATQTATSRGWPEDPAWPTLRMRFLLGGGDPLLEPLRRGETSARLPLLISAAVMVSVSLFGLAQATQDRPRQPVPGHAPRRPGVSWCRAALARLGAWRGSPARWSSGLP